MRPAYCAVRVLGSSRFVRPFGILASCSAAARMEPPRFRPETAIGRDQRLYMADQRDDKFDANANLIVNLREYCTSQN